VINGAPVTGRELRERLGGDAELVLRLSYLDADARRALFESEATGGATPRESEPVEAPSTPGTPLRRSHRASGDRVRIFGNVTVSKDEAIAGEVVAVIGSVRVDGEVGQQVVAVLGSVDLGPDAVVRGDVVSVGGRVRRAPGAQIRGGITEVSIGDPAGHVDFAPWLMWWAPVHWFGPFGAVPRLIGTIFRFMLLALLATIALLIARPTVEASAQRVADNPIKATLVGIVAQLLVVPVLVIVAFVLAISVIGIPLLLLLPFAVLSLVLMAFVGFSGTAYAIGQWTRRRLGVGSTTGVLDVCLGVLVLLLPVLIGRMVSVAGWPVTAFAIFLIAGGLAVEYLAWSSGFGAVLTNAFSRWQARRAARTIVQPPPAS
jgi:hypothetical protein